MRELESSLQSFGEYLLNARLVRSTAGRDFVRWVRRYLSRPATNDPLVDQVRLFCEELERNCGVEEWQVRQADQALRIYFVNVLRRTDWLRRPDAVVDQHDKSSPLSALDLLRTRVRTRHYSYRTECTYVDWVRRFLEVEQGVPLAQVRDLLGHASITTAERYDNQTLENLQHAVQILESGHTFAGTKVSRFFQDRRLSERR